MFSDTGDLSFYFGIFFIAISLGGIKWIHSIMKSKSLEDDKIDKIIDLGKWFIVSVGIALSVSIVNDGFKERNQDMEEFRIYDKYIKEIFGNATDNLERRRLLADYFSAVSPKGSIRNGWGKYKELVKADNDKYIEYIKIKEMEQSTLTEKQKEIIKTAEINNVPSLKAEWVIITGSDISVKAAQDEVNRIKKYPVHIYKKNDSLFLTVVGPFLNRSDALTALSEIKKEPNVRPDSYPIDFQTECKTTKITTQTIDNYIYPYTECNKQ